MTREEQLDAKVANEKTKLLATIVNGVAGGTVLGGFITPIIVTKQLDLWWGGFSIGGATILHLTARLILHDLRLEQCIMDPNLALAIPGGAVFFGLICLLINKLSIWRFDRKYPHLSRQGMRAIE